MLISSKLTNNHVVFTSQVLLDLEFIDVFHALPYEGSDPHTDVGGHHMHQAKPGHKLKLVDV